MTKKTGIGVLGVLLIVFIVLKLCGLIDWRWAIVLIPLWAGLAEFGIIFAICFISEWRR